ncbi:MAG: hypothetical protein IPM71_01365 [Bacteroidota bacterium]|nr:MAG: hypothetical protein IPM71_01365 [Bacteroidota bacterium]
MSFYRMFLLAAVDIALSLNLWAQTEGADIAFRSYSIDDGLSNYVIVDFEQDTNGFLWIATSDGLNRFDGYSFKVFKNNASSSSLPNNYINDLFVDNTGRLWVATNENGLAYYDQYSESFVRLMDKTSDTLIGNLKRIFRMAQDAENNLWLVCEEKGILCIDPYNFKVIQHCHANSSKGRLVSNNVTELTFDNQNQIWIGTTDRGIQVIDPKSSNVLYFSGTDDDQSGLEGVYVESLEADIDGKMWVSTDKGVFLYNPLQQKFLKILTYQAFAIKTLENGKSYFATREGLFEWVANNTLKVYRRNSKIPTSLSSSDIRCIFQDNSGSVWLGTSNGGVNTFFPYSKAFNTYKSEEDEEAKRQDGIVRSFTIDKDGNTWVATLSNGIEIIDKQTGVIHNLSTGNYKGLSFSSRSITTLFMDSKNNIWIGTWGTGAFLLKDGSTKFQNLVELEKNHKALVDNIVMCFYEDHRGNIWIGTEKGLDVYLPHQNELKRFHENKNKQSYDPNYSVQSNCIVEDAYHNLWLGTYGGLHRFVFNSSDSSNFYQSFRHSFFTSHSGKQDSLQDPRVISLYYDKALFPDFLFVGTYSQGLHIAHLSDKNLSLNSFEQVSLNEGLSNDVVYTILGDSLQNLWMGTNMGLCKYNVPDKKIENYFEHDGLQGNQFFWGSAYQAPSGELYFGGLKGYTSFYPDSIRKGSEIPPVVFTSLMVNNILVPVAIDSDKKGVLQKSILYTDKIILNHSEDVIAIEFSSLSFAFPEYNLFKYKLIGVDQDFILTDAMHRLVTYTHLRPGKYTFMVMGSNHEGVWNPQAISLEIVINPPYWQTWWFRGIMVFLLFVGILLFIRYRISNIKMQKIILERKVAAKTTELKSNYELLEKQKQQLDESNHQLLKFTNDLTNINIELNQRSLKIEDQAHELQVQADSLAQKNEELKQINATKDKFFNIIAHDLMNPLNSILGLAELLLDRFDDFEREKQLKFLHGIFDAASSLHELLANLLQWARTQSKRITIDPGYHLLHSVIDENLLLHREAMEKKQIQVQNLLDTQVRVYFDMPTINTVIRNLISNAIKFTSIEGIIQIHGKPAGDAFELMITDSGIGMSEARLKSLFQIDKAETTKGTHGEVGTGLGLILCREFMLL